MIRHKLKLTLLACVACLCACSHREERLFAELGDANVAPDRARAIGVELSTTRKGLDLAIADINIFGGKTRGWSSWILTVSKSTDLVEPRLKQIASDSAAPNERRMEAANILWLRTKDVSYLEQLFVIVQPAGNLETDWGRRALNRSIEPDEIRKMITVPARLPISLPLEKFKEVLQNPKNLRTPVGDQ